MKLDKLTNQLEGRQKGIETLFGAPAPAEAPPATSKRQPVPTSKRSTWKMRAWYVQPETASRLRAYVNRQQENGSSIDASGVVNEAIAMWLDQQGS
ncbi:hypothetical protein [Cyanobium sp. WAJ14-Wanaka]|uniref:hypothetical protein n=1 Tax=Cyanobium sp. WAJ14-Wanaka TaxID=2823725 RepID=UPI0020CDDFE8|nr:hypothetical protein [Cyanobium sp. WAJ14-Wanaka]MCP9776203.1 hypothetical protein [Cyanobium sp. WAJ14-Wanaka]